MFDEGLRLMRLALMQVVYGPACLVGDGWIDSSDPPPPTTPSRSRLSVADFQSATVGHECRALSKPWSSHSTGATVWCAVERRRGLARLGRTRTGQEAAELWDSDSPTSTSHPTTPILLLVLNHLPEHLQLHLSGSTSHLCSGFL